MTIHQLSRAGIKSRTSGYSNIDLESHRSSSPDQRWFIWRDTTHSPSLNMAIDEQCFNECDKLQGPLVRFYRWNRPAISIGYFQKYSLIPRSGYSIVRRPTGGGIVFHGKDVTYSILSPSSYWLYQITRRESYLVISEVILKSLLRIGLRGNLSENDVKLSHSNRSRQICFNNPAKFDVLVDRKKVAGAAQKRNRFGLLHQGSINLSPFPNIDREQLENHLITEFQILFASKMSSYKPCSEFFHSAGNLSNKKYCTSDWNSRR